MDPGLLLGSPQGGGTGSNGGGASSGSGEAWATHLVKAIYSERGRAATGAETMVSNGASPRGYRCQPFMRRLACVCSPFTRHTAIKHEHSRKHASRVYTWVLIGYTVAIAAKVASVYPYLYSSLSMFTSVQKDFAHRHHAPYMPLCAAHCPQEWAVAVVWWRILMGCWKELLLSLQQHPISPLAQPNPATTLGLQPLQPPAREGSGDQVGRPAQRLHQGQGPPSALLHRPAAGLQRAGCTAAADAAVNLERQPTHHKEGQEAPCVLARSHAPSLPLLFLVCGLADLAADRVLCWTWRFGHVTSCGLICRGGGSEKGTRAGRHAPAAIQSEVAAARHSAAGARPGRGDGAGAAGDAGGYEPGGHTFRVWLRG